MNKFVVLNDADNVATCLADVEPGTEIELTVAGARHALTVRDAIPFGHKIAVRPIALGEDVVKYGEIIGRASQTIEAGEWVHVHNVESVRARGDAA
jgi:altronate dehydratase small subunit